MLSGPTNKGNESLFLSLRSQNSNNVSPIRFTGRFKNSPRHDYIKKRVLSQMTANRTPSIKTSTAVSTNRTGSNLRNANATDFIELNRKMQTFSRSLGKEAKMGASSFRRHEGPALAQASFHLT